MVRYLCQSSPKWQRPVMLSKELHCVCVVHSWNVHSISWQTGFKFLLAAVPSDVIKWSVLFVFKHTNANFPAQCECTLTPTLLKCLYISLTSLINAHLRFFLCAQLDTLIETPLCTCLDLPLYWWMTVCSSFLALLCAWSVMYGVWFSNLH